MEVSRLDHLVLTVKCIDMTVSFYTSVLGIKKTVFARGRVALSFVNQKINLQEVGKVPEPAAANPIPGSADLCFLTKTPLDAAMANVAACGVEIICGPVERNGANGPIRSFYFRDPDLNLIELANEI